MSAAPSARSTSVGDLLTILGSAGLSLASSPAGADLAAVRTALLDPCAELVETKGGVLLAPGLTVQDTTARKLLENAADRGFNAVVMKAHGAQLNDLALAADAAGLALLVVDDQVEWLHLDSLLNNALATATQVGRSLSSLAIGDLFALASAIADAVGGATAIEDFSQRILAYSHLPSQPIDDDRREGILGRQVPDLPENEEQYRALYRAPGVVRFSAVPPALRRMAVAIRAGNEVLGSIWVIDPNGSLDDQAEQALLGVASTAALHVLRARSSEELARQQRAEMVRRLLEGSASPLQAAYALGLETRGPFAVLAFAHISPGQDQPEPATGRLLHLVTVHSEARVGQTGAAQVDGTVYVLAAGRRIRTRDALEHLAVEVVNAAAGLPRLKLVGAVSPIVGDINLVTDARSDADQVISLLRRRPGLGPVATAEKASDQLSLAGLARLLDADPRLVSVKAREMDAHDRAHKTDYRRHVVTYLDSLRDVTRAAKQLSMHPNTLRYRLRRAGELFALDLTDPDEVLLLWLALRSLPETDLPGLGS